MRLSQNFKTSTKSNQKSKRALDFNYLRKGRLFSIHIFDRSATSVDCRDILDAEKGMFEVYQKQAFIEIDTKMRIIGKMKRSVSFILL